MKFLIAFVLVVLLAVPAGLWFLSAPAVAKFDPAPGVLGAETPVTVKVESPHGVRALRAVVEQNGQRYTVHEISNPATRVFRRTGQAPQTVTFSAGTKRAPGLKEGKATLRVSVQANDLRAATAEIAQPVEVILRPPQVVPDGAQHYINQGGMELVTCTVSGYWTEAGVRVGKYTFRSFPMPNAKSPNERFAMFAYPWDLPPNEAPRVYARNPAGAEASAPLGYYKIFPKKFRARDLALDDAFLEKAVGQIDPGSTGDLASRFLKINGEMRRANNQVLSDLRFKTEEKILWNGAFLPMMGSRESFFADVRSYVYQGKKIDQQVHLGFDIAGTTNMPIPSQNDGKVVFAQNLGIYGNCVVVDHGYGLQSIYGHLSRIDVKPGDMVKKSQTLGLSGATGLAGGDHLHLSMQIDGVQINPVEWWDDHWIQDRILSKLPR